MSPTIARIGPYRIFFFSNERDEPPHVHVQRDRSLPKFWLEPVKLASSTSFASRELNRLARLVRERENEFLEAWNEYFYR